ncbi:glycosyl hydrolase [Niastella vici]|uniref:Glycosyl hydrolase n=1 Tax=Niastella vici TaxID=1703345 RepID=A0A1V9FZZ7_9BACT|nr:glycoside hydrolase family 3 C-terminal domain-containing protein [Niastella vici]OQP63941.1 glycosyl hydrolase [Niastella vici]
MKVSLVALGLTCCTIVKAQEYKSYPMWNAALPVEQRVTDLVSRLTLEEKVAQMLNTAPAIPRLGIPAYEWWNEVLHGVARTPYKTTVFPQAIAMAATWDTASLKLMAHYSAIEGRAINNRAVEEGKTGDRYKGLTYWTPNINIFRDPRWGRGQETYGEDPFLTAKLGAAFVSGLQGDDPRYLLAAACAKHYAVHSGPEPTRHTDNINPGLHDLWDTYLPAFRELVVNAKVAGVMCAYNAINGQPCCGNDLLMNDILRNQWKFTGYVTSDCWAIDDFVKNHKTHATTAAAAADAVMHGTDVECGTSVYKSLVNAVKDHIIEEKQIDSSLKRLFTIRYRLGMFDPTQDVPYTKIPFSVLEAPEHKALALKMAQQSIVLLKNEHNLLPLSTRLKKVAVIGPNADNRNALLGNYNGHPSHTVSILEGIREKLGANVDLRYEQGIDYTSDVAPSKDSAGKKADLKAIAARAADADVIIYVGGISPDLEGEEMSVNAVGFKGGDRTSILLPAVQTELLKELKATGKPVVFIVLTGSAIAIPWEKESIPAILNAWYGGQGAGSAVAAVLFGSCNPGGRLPVTFYGSDSDLPAFSDYSMQGRTYRYFKGEALFPFGYGLSYTTFKYSHVQMPATMQKGKPIMVTAAVTNTGRYDGEEVVQLYCSYPEVNAPIRALKGFQRFKVRKGETRMIVFRLQPEDLMVVDDSGNQYQPTGKLVISVGGGQPIATIKTTSNVVTKTILIK